MADRGTLLETIIAEKGGHRLVRIPGGTFKMGSPATEVGHQNDEAPQHEITLSEFYLGECPVTNQEYAEFIRENPDVRIPTYWHDRRYNRPLQPVVGIYWYEAKRYCNWAGLALPTEAQWEYACRAGTTTPYWTGHDEEDLARVAWYVKNSRSTWGKLTSLPGRIFGAVITPSRRMPSGRLHDVGELPPNRFGLRDMHGNIMEWCIDAYSFYIRPVQANDGLRSPGLEEFVSNIRRHRMMVPPNQSFDFGDPGDAKICRGGSFDLDALHARSASRIRLPSYGCRLDLGFRPMKAISP